MATIYQQLNEVMKDVQAVKKGSVNSQQGFKFRGIDAVINAVGPAFRSHGVIALPTLEEERSEEIRTNKGGSMTRVVLTVTYTFYGPEGDHVAARVTAEAFDSGDKATAKAMSVAYRTALLQVLCLPTDEPDPDSFSYERAASNHADTVTIAKPTIRQELNQELIQFSPDKSVRKAFVLGALDRAEIGSFEELTDAEVESVLKQLREGTAPFTAN
jgi:hypothetical protein